MTSKQPKVGEQYWAYMMQPTLTPPIKVTVTKTNLSKDLLDCEIDYDVEAENGDRCWNPYMVVNYSDKVIGNPDRDKYHADNIIKWGNEGYNFLTRKFENQELQDSLK